MLNKYRLTLLTATTGFIMPPFRNAIGINMPIRLHFNICDKECERLSFMRAQYGLHNKYATDENGEDNKLTQQMTMLEMTVLELHHHLFLAQDDSAILVSR